MGKANFKNLESFVQKIPAITGQLGTGTYESGCWWIKFKIDVQNPLAWNVVQELGHIVNYVSLDDRLPTIFYPVSPPPYMNGGPADFLSWIIESTEPDFSPDKMQEWLEERLPRPVENIAKWEIGE
jgi:hypothetical protein